MIRPHRLIPHAPMRSSTIAVIAVLVLLTGCGRGDSDPNATAEPDTLVLIPDTLASPGEVFPDTIAADDAPTPAPPDAIRATPPEQPTPSPARAPATFQGTAGSTDVERSVPGVVTLQAVRSGRHDGFDRVVFEFDGDFVPGYHIEYIDRPVRACGSGHVVELPGDAWLEIRMPTVRAHTEAGEATIQNRQRRPNLPVVKGLALTCDFEAVVTWALGVSTPNPYRVVELADPPRIALDVRH
jgi:hypothetical protein